MILGFDVSNNNGPIDWNLTGNLGYQFVSIKAGEGKDFKDSYFVRNWRAAGVMGLVRQAYDFARPSQGTGAEDAAAFCARVAPYLGVGDSVALDLEDDNVPFSADLLAYALDWLETTERILGLEDRPPMFYSRPEYMERHHLTNNATLAESGLWLASYQTTKIPEPVDGWPVVAAWQYSGYGRIPGIQGYVDLDVFNGTLDQLLKYGKSAA